MYFADDMGRTFELDVHKRKDRTIIYGNGWEQYIAQNNFIGGEYISFSMNREVNRLRTMYFCSDDDDNDQDHDDSQYHQDDGDSQDDEGIRDDEDR